MQPFRLFPLFLAVLFLMAAPGVSPAMGGFNPSGNEPSPFFGLGAGKRGRVAPGEGKIGTADRDVAPDLERAGLSKEAVARQKRDTVPPSAIRPATASSSANATGATLQTPVSPDAP